jgi:hypothetical protein
MATIEFPVKDLAKEVVDELERRRSQPSQDWPAVMKIETAARYLDRKPAAIRHLLAAKIFPSVKIDGRTQIRRVDIDRIVEKSTE